MRADGSTALFWLPDEDNKALAVIEVLLAHGADPQVRNENGLSAADIADRRGLGRAAQVLREALRRMAGVRC
jgi:ankyrin repeat protein